MLQAAVSSSAAIDQLRTEGYIVLKSVLTPKDCDALQEHVLVTADAALAQSRSDLFGNIQQPENRNDLKLDLCPPVINALNSFAARCEPVLTDVVGGSVRIVELAAITSRKGAVAQQVHADTVHGVTRFLQSDVQLPTRDQNSEDSDQEGYEEDVGSVIRAVATDTALIFTALVALQDIAQDMGPTHVWPSTHTVAHHATLWSSAANGTKMSVAKADQEFGIAHLDMTLSKGDLVLYDSRTMHCGGANVSETARSVLCISCMGPGIRPDGTTWTMLSSLRNHLYLSSLPLLASAARTPANTSGSREVILPPPPVTNGSAGGKHAAATDLKEETLKEIPPLEDWEAAVQCSLCGRWRPCSAEEAPRLTGTEGGFQCPLLGFSCMKEQGYTDEEVDALF